MRISYLHVPVAVHVALEVPYILKGACAMIGLHHIADIGHSVARKSVGITVD